MNATDATAAVFGTLFGLLLIAGLYVWMSLALSAVFRKSGVEGWKAWVPVLNSIVLLQLAGLSPWLLLVALVPVLGWVALVVLFAMTYYRLNLAFGFGVGMTVLAVLAAPVWASIVGWGSARWVGRETDAASRGAGPRRTSVEAGLPPLPPFPAPGAPAPAPASGFAPPPAYVPPMSGPVRGTAPAATAGPLRGAAPAAPAPAAGPAPVAANPAAPSDVAAPAGGWTPPPLPGRPVASAAPAEQTSDPDPWQGFALDSTDASAEVTGAFPGAPAPVSALPAPAPAAPASAPIPASAPVAAAPAPAAPTPARAAGEVVAAPDAATTGEEGITRPPVTHVPSAGGPMRGVPAAPAGAEAAEPWAPRRSSMTEAEAFPETSGPVSAIAGAPDAGSPRSARSSVSAFHDKPEIPAGQRDDDGTEASTGEDELDDHDVFEETIVARRKRTDWMLVPPTGAPVALSADVVILGRRPAADPAYPGAQLVSIQDGTVSKTHARLQLRDDRWYVIDLGSTNGVLFATVLGTEVEAPSGEEVEAGDRFLLGDAEVRLQRSDG